jgi:hypothetical protein
VPVLAALTAGIAASQARAVAEGALGRRSPFVRTPKAGASPRRYRAAIGWSWLVEAALAAHLGAGAVLAATRGAWSVAAFLGLFATGCAWVACATVLDR